MANIKFSDFTQLAPIDQAESYIVGYEGDASTNNRWLFGEVAIGLKAVTATPYSIYAADGTLEANRDITFSAHYLKLIATGSGKLYYQDNNQGAGKVLKSDADGLASWAAETTYTLTGIGTDNTSSGIRLSNSGGDVLILGAGNIEAAQSGNTITLTGTDTNTNIANANLVADAARTLTMGAHNLTIASTTAGQEVKFGQNVRVDGQGYTLQNDQSGITIDWDTGNVQYITLASGSQTFAPSNAESGATYILQLRQPGSGAAGTINWNNLVNWPGGAAPTLTATNGAFDVITLMYNGTLSKYFGTVVLDLK